MRRKRRYERGRRALSSPPLTSPTTFNRNTENMMPLIAKPTSPPSSNHWRYRLWMYPPGMVIPDTNRPNILENRGAFWNISIPYCHLMTLPPNP